MGFGIDYQCPQCGAPVVLDESDRLFACAFCRVRLYITFPDNPRYLIPSRSEPGHDIVHVPYWRYRGVAYFTQGLSVGQRIVDTSFLARPELKLPFTLGLRPQAMKLTFITPETPGTFLSHGVPFDAAFSKAHRVRAALGEFALPEDAGECALASDTSSLIYAPFLTAHGQVLDAVTREPLRLDPALLDAAESGPPPATASFLSTLCPACGWDMEGERSSRVMCCRNCDTAWTPTGGEMTQVGCAWLPPPAEAAGLEVEYLPFWSIRADVPALHLASYADFARTANLPLVVRPEWAETPFAFNVPAFRIQPALYLRLAKQFTSARPWSEPRPGLPKGKIYPVTMPSGEIESCLKMFLAESVAAKRVIFPRLPEIEVTPRSRTLIFLPFLCYGPDRVQPDTGLAINAAALNWGKAL